MADEMKFRAETQQDIEEIEKEKQKKKFELASVDLNYFFENFIKKDMFVKEEDLGDGLVIRVKPLNIGELIEAEGILRNMNPDIAMDAMVRLRAAAILSKAIMKIGDNLIEKPGLDEESINYRRFTLYSQLIQMPPIIIEKMYRVYLDAVEEQATYYSTPVDDIMKKSEDFSTAPSEE